jgi:1-acyl-sn-glycerol-3-phosphate acyltransferase
MENIIVYIINFLSKKKSIFIGLLFILVLVLGAGWTKLNINSSIYSVFPQNENYEGFLHSIEDSKLFNKIIFSVAMPEVNEEQLASISHRLTMISNGGILNLKYKSESSEVLLLDHLYEAPYYFLNNTDYNRIEKQLSRDSIRTYLQGGISQMNSFNSFYFNNVLAKDPMGFLTPHLKQLNPNSDASSVNIREGYFYNSDLTEILIIGSVNSGINAEKENLILEAKLDELIANFKTEGIEIHYFAPFLIANSNVKQVKKDTHLTLAITLILVIGLLLLYYRSLIISLFFIIPVVLSAIIGMGLFGYLQTNISAISIAASAVLLGIVLDYSFHFLTHYSHSGCVQSTVKQIAKPMLVGSFTTMGAFAALMFTESKVLNDFGLMALLILLSAVFVTLIILPVFIEISTYKAVLKPQKTPFRLPKLGVKLALIATIGLCLYAFFSPPSVSFDSDLRNLMYQTEEMKQRQSQFTGLNSELQKKLIINVESSDLESALIANQKLYTKLVESKDLGVQQIVSAAPFIYAKSLLKENKAQWIKFWSQHQHEFIKDFTEIADSVGFNTVAFEPFFNSLSTIETKSSNTDLLKNLSLLDLITTTDNHTRITTSITVNINSIDKVIAQVNEIEEASVFETSQMAGALLKSVKNDFSYLLIFSSVLVFLSLLLVYGRLEIAIFSFLPMAVSWIWILYLATFLDLQFNFVNIMLATIIFGLGDDFSIFVTDGLLKKYRYKSKVISSYTSAILLSASTTIIGTGVLFFAKHPAIHSIALLSVVGIISIVFVTLLVQPALFDLFVTSRVEKRKDPLSLRDLFYTIYVYFLFLLGCLLINIQLLLLFPLPIAKKKKRILFNYIIHYSSRMLIFLTFQLKLSNTNRSKLNFSKPSIIVSNHNSFIDIILLLHLSPKLILVVKDWVYDSPLFGLLIRYSGFICIREGVSANLVEMKQRVDQGYSIAIFPEGTRSASSEMLRFHKGAFYAAQELGLPIQAIAITGLDYMIPKNDLIIKPGPVHYNVLELVSPTHEWAKLRLGAFAKSVKNEIQKTVNSDRNKLYTAKEQGERVLRNYRYKGPVLEWYTKIKWQLERTNFDYYESLIGDRQIIYDLGCGYGYFSFFLHYKNENRIIKSIDYDEEKIKIADCCFDKKPSLNFKNLALQKVTFENFDIAFFNDVLHYLPKKERLEVLQSAVKKINPNGLIVIRDGFSDTVKAHKKTLLSEWFSTKLLRFNKTENDLEFLSTKELKDFAITNKLSFTQHRQNNQTSNDLIILKK